MADLCDLYTSRMDGMLKNRHIEIQYRKKIIDLYTLCLKLKETYNECQFYMSFEDLKTFYETSFFTKSTFCKKLHDFIKSNNSSDLFLPRVKSTYYISYLTFALFFKSKEMKYLLNKSLGLELQSSQILKELIALGYDNPNVQLDEFISSYAQNQEQRIKVLTRMIDKYY